MARGHLDKKILEKIADKLEKKRSAINVKVSQKASKLGISSEAALILLAKELGIGTANYQRKLDSAKQAEVRESLPVVFTQKNRNKKSTKSSTNQIEKPRNKKTILSAAIEYLIHDEELLGRCRDILLAKSNFDRPINQATLVLEDRIRKKSKPGKRLVGENLIGYAFNADLDKTVLKISNISAEQGGFTFILKGIVPTFRNPTHHHVTNEFSQEDALRICSFIDVLLRLVDKSEKIK